MSSMDTGGGGGGGSWRSRADAPKPRAAHPPCTECCHLVPTKGDLPEAWVRISQATGGAECLLMFFLSTSTHFLDEGPVLSLPVILFLTAFVPPCWPERLHIRPGVRVPVFCSGKPPFCGRWSPRAPGFLAGFHRCLRLCCGESPTRACF